MLWINIEHFSRYGDFGGLPQIEEVTEKWSSFGDFWRGSCKILDSIYKLVSSDDILKVLSGLRAETRNKDISVS